MPIIFFYTNNKGKSIFIGAIVSKHYFIEKKTCIVCFKVSITKSPTTKYVTIILYTDKLIHFGIYCFRLCK